MTNQQINMTVQREVTLRMKGQKDQQQVLRIERVNERTDTLKYGMDTEREGEDSIDRDAPTNLKFPSPHYKFW